MNKSQQAAVDYFRRHLEDHIRDYQREQYGRAITKFKTEPTDYDNSFWLSAEVEDTALPDNNLLKALDHEWWHVSIGPRGRISVWSCPNSFKQFKNRYAFGMLFTKHV